MSVLPIENLDRGVGGGKAQGLTLLNCFKANIPMSFVVRQYDVKSIKRLLKSLPDGIKFAIRSSGEGEDGDALSFAGQYISYLNVVGETEILEAIKKCFLSQKQKNVEAYNENLNKSDIQGMNVIIQEMVEAKASGVLFTSDPVNNRHDRISLSITKGLGEDLMSGLEDGEQFTFFKHGENLPESNIISPDSLKHLVKQAIEIDSKFGRPADLEWAMDANNKIWWLQLRPITVLEDVHLNELDDEPLYNDPIHTRGNIGEMMPGPVTPLTLSTFAKAIDVGLQVFYKKTGAQKQIKKDERLFIHSFYNHLFFDMHRLYESARYVGMTKKENIDFAVVGKIVPNLNVKKVVSPLISFKNFLLMTRYINSSPKSLKKLRELHETFSLNCNDNIEDCYNLIDTNLDILDKAYTLHYVTSSQSGALYSAIINIFSGGKIPQQEHQKMANSLFSDIPNVESAEVIKSLDIISSILVKEKKIKSSFIEANDKDSLEYLEKNGSEELINNWNKFISRHGHRCVREAEMFEKEWASDPRFIIESLKAKTTILLNFGESTINGKKNTTAKIEVNGLSGIKKRIVKILLPKARKAVARREQTKAWSVGIQNKFKLAYRHLSSLLVEQNFLDHKDQIFFLQHNEIGKLIKGDRINHWKNIAASRMLNYPKMQELEFEDLYFGIPSPQAIAIKKESSELTGIPVSQGKVTAKVRIVKNIEDAAKLQKGEIMVAKFTDVGWTPFYGIISGLITEIGSPLSHGAVVAREYGLPSIVSMKGATTSLETGQTIILDAFNGSIKLVEDLEVVVA